MRDRYRLKHLPSLLTLCMAVVVDGFIATSMLSYSSFMVLSVVPSTESVSSWLPNITTENVGYFSAILTSSFFLGRGIMLSMWFTASDLYGPTAVLQLSLILSCLFTMLFGFSTDFYSALFWRFLLGMASNLLGAAKEAVLDLTKNDHSSETRMMGILTNVWITTSILSPGIAGVLADPLSQFDLNNLPPKLQEILREYPFAVPNVLCAVLCVFAIAMVDNFLRFALPPGQPRSTKLGSGDLFTVFPGILSVVSEGSEYSGDTEPFASERTDNTNYGAAASAAAVLATNFPELPSEMATFAEIDIENALRVSIFDYGQESLALSFVSIDKRGSLAYSIMRWSLHEVEDQHMKQFCSFKEGTGDSQDDDETPPAPPNNTQVDEGALWDQKSTRKHLLVYWLILFVMGAMSEVFPLFCLSQVAGLGLQEAEIGLVFSVSAAVAAVLQYFGFPQAIEEWGLYGSVRVSIGALGPVFAVIPLMVVLLFPMTDSDQDYYTSTTVVACVCLGHLWALVRVLCSSMLSFLLVATNRTVSPSRRDELSHIALRGGHVAQTFGPLVAGVTTAAVATTFPMPVSVAVLWGAWSAITVGLSLVVTLMLDETQV